MFKWLTKRLVRARKAKRLAKTKELRAKHSWEQAQLMYEALGEREY